MDTSGFSGFAWALVQKLIIKYFLIIKVNTKVLNKRELRKENSFLILGRDPYYPLLKHFYPTRSKTFFKYM